MPLLWLISTRYNEFKGYGFFIKKVVEKRHTFNSNMLSRAGSQIKAPWFTLSRIGRTQTSRYSTKKINIDHLAHKTKVLADKQKDTVKRRQQRKDKLESYGTLNESLNSFFEKQLYKEKKTTSKTTEAISSTFSIYPPKFDIDETQLSNKEYRDAGLSGETKAVAKFWGIFPDVIPTFLPRINLTVRYPDERIVYRGNHLTIDEARSKPEISYKVLGGARHHWSLLMIDPDTPFPAEGKPHLAHYLITNIPGSEIDRGTVVSDYIPAAPPKHSGIHRYIYLLFQQRNGPIDVKMETFEERYINLESFMEAHSLVPKGISFFQAQYNETCDEIYKELGMEMPNLHPSAYPKKVTIKERRYSAM